MFELRDQLRNNLQPVAHETHVSDIENRRVGVGIYGNDLFGALDGNQVLDRTGNTYPDIEVGGDCFSSLSDLSFIGHYAGFHNRP